jgi:hypothetical protein
VRATLALSANRSAWDEAPVKAKAYVQAETLLARSVSLSGSLTHHGRLTARASARYGSGRALEGLTVSFPPSAERFFGGDPPFGPGG